MVQHGARSPTRARAGGFKTLRYIDSAGHECAFYDTALLFPTNAINLSGPSLGVAVLDMSDPAHPVQTDTLTELPMLSPHESLALNPKRGLLAAVLGNPSTYPGLVSIYDAHADCRHPVLQSTALVARFGHESGFSPDGKTFYAAGTAVQGDHGDRRHGSEGAAPGLARQRALARHVAQQRRQPRLHRRRRAAATC